MNVFVTGGTGLLGFFLIKNLLEKGYVVNVLIRNTTDKLLFNSNPNLHFIEGDIFDIYTLEKIIQKSAIVYHCVASVSFDRRKKSVVFKTNIEGTQNIVELCKKYNVYLCHVSSVAALGRKKGNTVIDENAKWVESDLNSIYAISKNESEILLWRAFEEGLRGCIVNPSVIIGPTNWNKSTAKIFKYIIDEKPFYTTGDINWVDVRDVAEIMILLSEKQISNERYIINAGVISYKELFYKIALQFNKRKPFIKATPFLSYLAWIFESIKSIITGNEPLVTKDSIKAASNKFWYKNDKIIDKLDFKFRTIDETLKWTCAEILHLNSNVEK